MPITALLIAAGIGTVAALLWLKRDRHYESSESVAAAYDAWTNDRLLERLWGEHVHLGYYGNPPRPRDFRKAKETFVHALVKWSGLDQLPPGSRVLDVEELVGVLASGTMDSMLGISISPATAAN